MCVCVCMCVCALARVYISTELSRRHILLKMTDKDMN